METFPRHWPFVRGIRRSLLQRPVTWSGQTIETPVICYAIASTQLDRNFIIVYGWKEPPEAPCYEYFVWPNLIVKNTLWLKWIRWISSDLSTPVQGFVEKKENSDRDDVIAAFVWKLFENYFVQILPNHNHLPPPRYRHYNDVTMSAMASQTTGISIVYSTVCPGVHQGKHQSSPFVRESTGDR